MYLKVKVHPNSRVDTVLRKAPDSLEVFVRAKPVDGKANDAVRKLLLDFLKVPASKLRLIRGATSRSKLFELVV
ncbi:MAG TPA: DUF167 domain-containing protein [Candidatus Kryptonia bacterium]